MSDLDVNMTQMTLDADGFINISSLSEKIGSDLRDSLSLLGDFWGDDTVGGEFLAQWGPSISGLLDTLSGLGDGMDATAVGVVTSATLYRKSNEVNEDLAG